MVIDQILHMQEYGDVILMITSKSLDKLNPRDEKVVFRGI